MTPPLTEEPFSRRSRHGAEPPPHLRSREFPSGQTSSHPDVETCFIPRSLTIEAEEARLPYALTALAGNTSFDIPVDAALIVVHDMMRFPEQEFLVRVFAPEIFFFEFLTQAVRDLVLAAGRVLVERRRTAF